MSNFETFKYSFQISPILLTGGIAANLPGGGLPIIALTQPNVYSGGILGFGGNVDLDDFFCNYVPMSGSTLGSNDIGRYPFANQQVAANAVIVQPLKVSLMMICPANPDTGGFFGKMAVMSALQATLLQHDISGGTYTIATPSYFYVNCIKTNFEDISGQVEGPRQAQSVWRLDFEQPLVTLQQAQQAQNNLMGKISSGTQISGQPTWSGTAATTGNPSSGVTPSVIPTTTNAAGASIVSPIGEPNASGGLLA